MPRLPWTKLILLGAALTVAGCAAAGPPRRSFSADDLCADDRDCPVGFECLWDEDRFDCLPSGTGPRVPPPPEGCREDEDCPDFYECIATECVSLCADVTCEMGQECRRGMCIDRDETGAFCEFDSECGENFLCIAGRCTWDPRVPRSCADGAPCPGDLVCMGGECVCTGTSDCPIGTVCEMGMCIPEDGGCVADSDCPDGHLCDGGTCIPGTACDVTHPDLGGDWDVETTLHLRDSLPSWLSSFLGAVDGPLQFISGRTDDPDLGLPSAIERAVGRAIRNWAEDNIPRSVLEVLGFIGDLSDILETWEIDEEFRIGPDPSGVRDAYVGNHVWNEVCFEYRRRDVCGTTDEIINTEFRPAEFSAQAVCGTFNINRHDVDVNIGGIIAWAVNALVEETTGYETLEEMLQDERMYFCDEVAYLAHDAAALITEDLGPVAEAAAALWCNNALDDLISDLNRALNMARVGGDLMKLKGFATIAGPRSLTPGTWEGTLLGGDFPGSFTARR